MLLDEPIQGFTTGVLEDEHRPAVMTRQCDWLRGPRRVQFGCQGVFVLEAAQILGEGRFSGDHQGQDRHRVAALRAAVEHEVRPLAKRLQLVSGFLCHRFSEECQLNQYRALLGATSFQQASKAWGATPPSPKAMATLIESSAAVLH